MEQSEVDAAADARAHCCGVCVEDEPFDWDSRRVLESTKQPSTAKPDGSDVAELALVEDDVVRAPGELGEVELDELEADSWLVMAEEALLEMNDDKTSKVEIEVLVADVAEPVIVPLELLGTEEIVVEGVVVSELLTSWLVPVGEIEDAELLLPDNKLVHEAVLKVEDTVAEDSDKLPVGEASEVEPTALFASLVKAGETDGNNLAPRTPLKTGTPRVDFK
ncbi:Hypothetical predicted protein [Lecanosticta acicola]|uniref:Uncharacterized protein n=1 Tax=Lecanosticta acicola TaxID=111012 RepID=A0AAI8YUS8_9PEZI|nr:Hypothetical predicted protein [Lecanosticta acicola]